MLPSDRLTHGRPLYLVPLGSADVALAEWMAPELDRQLDTKARVSQPIPLRLEWYSRVRDQYHSSAIVDALVSGHRVGRRNGGSAWTLGLADVDLFAENRPFVFGEATVGGPCALVSTARLTDDGDADLPLLRGRVLKEALHELGHLAGLRHCDAETCVMMESFDLEETDRKSASFCPTCKKSLASVISGIRG